MLSAVYLSPPKLAKQWGISPDKVIRWIRSGELNAANLGDATRPRYRISESDATRFWETRQTIKQQAIARRARRAVARPCREYI